MALIGGSLTGSLVFVLPPLIYTRALALKEKSSHVVEKRTYSGSRKRFNGEEQLLMDPAAHSRSIYYGFLNVTNTPHRYRILRYMYKLYY